MEHLGRAARARRPALAEMLPSEKEGLVGGQGDGLDLAAEKIERPPVELLKNLPVAVFKLAAGA